MSIRGALTAPMLKSPRPLKTKRNFKALQLPELTIELGAAKQETEPVPSRPAPQPAAAADRRRPPPLQAEAMSSPLTAGSPAAGRTRSAIQASLTSTLARLDIMGAARLDLRNEDLTSLQELGHGNGGSVVKALHVPSGTIMAKKIVLIDAKPAVRKQILRELQIIHECNSPYIVSPYGAFLAEPNICICMEFMDKGSFDGIYKKMGPIDIAVVAKVALSVVEGLMYLYDVHRIIHRDIKPSNILCNSKGEIKLCDFGVSGELINSIAHTFVGTSIYMSPERIQGAEYTVKSDVWSLGISLIELANGRFPFSGSTEEEDDEDELYPIPDAPEPDMDLGQEKTPTHGDTSFPPYRARARSSTIKSGGGGGRNKRKSTGVSLHGEGMTMSILELMHQIVNEPAPRLCMPGSPEFAPDAIAFVDACLIKLPEERKMPKALLGYEWMEWARRSTYDVRGWANSF